MRFTKLKAIAIIAVAVLGVTAAVAALVGPTPEPPTPGSDKAPGDPPKTVAGEQPDPEKLLKPLQCKWRVLSDVMSAEQVAADPFGIADTDRLSRTRVIVDKDKMITDEGRMEAVRFTVELRFPADAGPQAIDLVVTDGPKELFGTAVPAIYKLDGDRLTLCVRDTEHLNKGRPKEFKSDKTQGVEVLERVTDDEAELKALAGEWTGKKLTLTDEKVLADKGAKPKWTFDGSGVLLGGEGELGEKATIKLDPSESPPTIEMTITQGKGKGKGTKLAGVYCRQENKLTVCFRDPKFKDAPAPTMLFLDTDVLYFVLERTRKK